MTDAMTRRSPLAGRDRVIEMPDLEIRERPFTAKVNLRGAPGDPVYRDEVRGILDIYLPERPNSVAGGAGCLALWLGPDEWLITGEPGEEHRMVAALRAGLSSVASSVVDVSDAQTVLRVEGHKARKVLQKGCRIDLHPRVFAAGSCAQTGLAKASVLLHQAADTPQYDIYVDASFAVYLWSWLYDASLEYQVSG